MSEGQKSFPVRYMVTECVLWPYYAVRDTSLEGQGKIIAKAVTLESAHIISKLLNESEGYVYEPK